MLVGFGTARLPVIPGEPMGGYADRAGGVDAELDPLEVRAVVFATPRRSFALVVVDLVCVNTDVVQEIRDAVSGDVDACWVAATHTHASPDAGCRPGGARTPPELATRLVDAARSAVEAAVQGRITATVGTPRRVEVKGLGGRRSVAHPEPQTVPVDVVAIRGESGEVTGLLVVQPVHPTVLPPGNRSTSADLSGAVRRALGRRIPWVVVMTGSAGDLSTRHTRQARDAAELDRLGALVANAVFAGCGPAPRRPVDEVGTPVGQVVALAPKNAADLPGLDDLRRRPDQARTFQQGLEMATEMLAHATADEFEIRVETVTVGGVALVAVPAEPFLCLGERIRAESPRPAATLVLGYTNGYLGYLPCREAFAEPDYEVLASPVRRGSGEQVVDAAVRLTNAV